MRIIDITLVGLQPFLCSAAYLFGRYDKKKINLKIEDEKEVKKMGFEGKTF